MLRVDSLPVGISSGRELSPVKPVTAGSGFSPNNTATSAFESYSGGASHRLS